MRLIIIRHHRHHGTGLCQQQVDGISMLLEIMMKSRKNKMKQNVDVNTRFIIDGMQPYPLLDGFITLDLMIFVILVKMYHYLLYHSFVLTLLLT